MGDEDFTADEFKSWILINKVLELSNGVVGNNIYHEVVNRLRDGQITARFKTGFGERSGYRAKYIPLDKISTKIWADLAKSNHLSRYPFWLSNTVEVSIRGDRLHSPETKCTFYGVKLDPDGIADMLESFGIAPPALLKVPTPPPTPVLDPPSLKKVALVAMVPVRRDAGPLLSAPALGAWYQAYKLAYTVSERNLDHAWAHAKQAFPEKTVTRKAVRDLMPGGKPGPRPKV